MGGRVQEHVILLGLVRGQGFVISVNVDLRKRGRADLAQAANASRLIPSTSAVRGTRKYVLRIPVSSMLSNKRIYYRQFIYVHFRAVISLEHTIVAINLLEYVQAEEFAHHSSLIVNESCENNNI